MANPVLVEVTRGDLVESRHRGALAVVEASGAVVMARGDIQALVFPRSAVKPIQAVPLVETGAADRYRLGDVELALACASHHGEPAHVAAVLNWLTRLGLSVDDLECAPHPPYCPHAAQLLARTGTAPSPLHNNCSGKHAGFLTTALHLGEPIRGYTRHDHPVQMRVSGVLGEMADFDVTRAPRGIDGCGMPVFGIPLVSMARVMARLAAPRGLGHVRAAAAGRILAAMAAEPVMVDGTHGFAARLMMAAGVRARIKPGAEGVVCAVLPELGYGVAVKIDDGAARAAEVAMGWVLERLRVLDPAQRERLGDLLRPPVQNAAGRTVGELRPALGD